VADDGVHGRMDCIDHSTTTTRLLRLLENRGWLQFHRVLEPVRRIRYLFAVHFSAQIEEFGPVPKEPQPLAADPVRFVVDSWFRDNGQPAVVLPLPTGSTAKARKRPRGWSWSQRGLAMVRQSNVSRGRK
jgi:hypothetical protein